MAYPQIANFSGHAIQTRGHSLLRRFSRHCPYHRDRLPGPKRADPQGCLPQEPRKNRGATEDYLRDTRDAPLSPYEIKAGREIPAVLEQSFNSDLPGEFKALVTYHVYDTATDEYLLIPQGARLAGKYDSRVSCSQDGVLVAWSLVLSPDASSIDLDGNLGLNSHDDAGLPRELHRNKPDDDSPLWNRTERQQTSRPGQAAGLS